MPDNAGEGGSESGSRISSGGSDVSGSVGEGLVHATASHPCREDVYRGTYLFRFMEGAHVDQWSLRWDVSGPRHDYTSQTDYTRL